MLVAIEIPIQVMETYLHLLERNGKKTQDCISSHLLKSGGWFTVARIREYYRLSITPGCEEHLRYRYELAETLVVNVFLYKMLVVSGASWTVIQSQNQHVLSNMVHEIVSPPLLVINYCVNQ